MSAPVLLAAKTCDQGVTRAGLALNVNRYGETGTSYLPHLKKMIYRRRNMAIGYGLKVWPEDLVTVQSKAPEALNLEGL